MYAAAVKTHAVNPPTPPTEERTALLRYRQRLKLNDTEAAGADARI